MFFGFELKIPTYINIWIYSYYYILKDFKYNLSLGTKH